ncbi:MAG: thioredoxin family protein [Candidatus Bathyarchaeota archaeon]|nr:thioredoxin family protein [Candidatus Bathyarchaeota archaeon]
MTRVEEAHASTWEETVSRSDGLTVVDFWHKDCPYCLALNPIFDEVSDEYEGRINFVKLNVKETSENGEIAIHCGVKGFPTLMFFWNGEAVGQLLGFKPKEGLKKLLDETLKKHVGCLR